MLITGGPGSGKTSLIEALSSRGYGRTVEAGRAIIQDQMAIDGRALPWRDPLLFAELMLSMDMLSYRLAEQSVGPVFFDRGIPDVSAYLRPDEYPRAEHMHNAARTFSYNNEVLIAPPWRRSLDRITNAKQDFDEAIRTYDALVATYTALGYDLRRDSASSVGRSGQLHSKSHWRSLNPCSISKLARALLRVPSCPPWLELLNRSRPERSFTKSHTASKIEGSTANSILKEEPHGSSNG
jgi:predicted ATPase